MNRLRLEVVAGMPGAAHIVGADAMACILIGQHCAEVVKRVNAHDDLLAALQGLLEYATAEQPGHLPGSKSTRLIDTADGKIAKARAAIAKAGAA